MDFTMKNHQFVISASSALLATVQFLILLKCPEKIAAAAALSLNTQLSTMAEVSPKSRRIAAPQSLGLSL
jgi:hypothetical protein